VTTPVRSLVLVLGFAVLTGCLPDDTRKAPGRLDVTVTSDYALSPSTPGFDTADGWHVEYDRFLITLGEVALGGDDCTPYNDTDYSRVLDALLDAPQKLSAPVALGACDFRFRMRPPPDDAVLGVGVTAADLKMLREPGSDGFAEDSGSAVYVSGKAQRAADTKRFAWSFRLGAQFDDCKLLADSGVSLSSDDQQSVDITLRSAALFQSVPNDALAERRFAPFAEADDVHGNGDGSVTLEELASVPLGANATFDRWDSFADYVYTGLVPKLPRFRGAGICSIGPIDEGGHGPGGGKH